MRAHHAAAVHAPTFGHDLRPVLLLRDVLGGARARFVFDRQAELRGRVGVEVRIVGVGVLVRGDLGRQRALDVEDRGAAIDGHADGERGLSPLRLVRFDEEARRRLQHDRDLERAGLGELDGPRVLEQYLAAEADERAPAAAARQLGDELPVPVGAAVGEREPLLRARRHRRVTFHERDHVVHARVAVGVAHGAADDVRFAQQHAGVGRVVRQHHDIPSPCRMRRQRDLERPSPCSRRRPCGRAACLQDLVSECRAHTRIGDVVRGCRVPGDRDLDGPLLRARGQCLTGAIVPRRTARDQRGWVLARHRSSAAVGSLRQRRRLCTGAHREPADGERADDGEEDQEGSASHGMRIVLRRHGIATRGVTATGV